MYQRATAGGPLPLVPVVQPHHPGEHGAGGVGAAHDALLVHGAAVANDLVVVGVVVRVVVVLLLIVLKIILNCGQ